MPSHVLSFAILSIFARAAFAQDTPTDNPLTNRRIPYNQIPYKVDTDPTGRGPQSGYNLCNSTTEGPTSQCQTAMVNSADDWCLWGLPDPNSLVGNEEAASVAYCTKPGHGTRIMPAGTITGMQFLKAPAYLLVAGTIKQENVNLDPTDGGGEMDPHGADERGNPLGGLVYTNGFPSNGGNNNSFQQVIEWHNFMGSSQFCFKVCDPSIPNSKQFCNNIFDLTGCNFVAPASYQTDVFEACDSDNMDPVGVYTGADGKTSTYKQVEPVVSLPSVKTPSSSNCRTFASTDLFAAAGTVSGPAGSSTGTSSGASSTGSATGSQTNGVKTSTTTGKPSGTNTSSQKSGAPTTSTSGAAGARVDLGLVGAGPFVAIAMSVLAGLGAVVVGL